MIGPMNNAPVYPLTVDNLDDQPAPGRNKRSLENTSSTDPANTSANDRSRRRTGGGLDSLGRGNIL